MDDRNAALLTDLYQLTMLEAYFAEGLTGAAVFDLFVRRLPPARNYLLACGLDDALRYLERLSFSSDALAYLESLNLFSAGFLEWLAKLRFTGDVRALPEGTAFFAGEPVLEVTAPLPEAQLAETFLLNQVHLQTLAASKAVRVVTAAGDRRVVDFGLRRMHGTDAGMKAARAFHVAGVAATSNVLAGRAYGIPLAGTMGHSYVEAHAEEREALRAFAALWPGAVLLVDTYDTLAGVREVIEMLRVGGPDVRVRAVRLDSGDLGRLAREARRMLDGEGLADVQIFASGGLDEHEIAELVATGAPIDGFGVGSKMAVSADAPYLDCAYKLVEYGGRGRMKLSPDKATLPARKQVFRRYAGGAAAGDVIALAEDAVEGRPLLVEVMREGRRLPAGRVDLEESRRWAREEVASLPPRCRALAPADPPYPVELSPALEAERLRLAHEVRRGG